jgi:hypothetical protein
MPVRVVLNSSILLSELSDVLDLKLKLANSTEAELRSLQSSLQNSKDEVAADLQRNVFKKCVPTLTSCRMHLRRIIATPSSFSSPRKLGHLRTI